jgi:hypothetical protein
MKFLDYFKLGHDKEVADKQKASNRQELYSRYFNYIIYDLDDYSHEANMSCIIKGYNYFGNNLKAITTLVTTLMIMAAWTFTPPTALITGSWSLSGNPLIRRWFRFGIIMSLLMVKKLVNLSTTSERTLMGTILSI